MEIGGWRTSNRFVARQLHLHIAVDVLDYAEALCACPLGELLLTVAPTINRMISWMVAETIAGTFWTLFPI